MEERRTGFHRLTISAWSTLAYNTLHYHYHYHHYDSIFLLSPLVDFCCAAS